uniref:Single-stranded DNA-binding protein WHY2, mitochondrial n=1 Tax=Vitis vinifera TaxID=29760 RepID=A5B3B9_VITVI|nr:hypothetical protein VITISV_034895 [Vitis vinifera]
MMKLKQLLQSRTHLSENLLHGKPGDIRNPSWLHAFTSRVSLSTATDHFADKGNYPDRVYAPYCVYKGKASLTVYPVLPKFSRLDSGGLKVDRHGVMMLQFSPAVGERKYDWEKKQFFALSAVEVGSLLSLSPGGGCEFFHDPSMKTRRFFPDSVSSGHISSLLSLSKYPTIWAIKVFLVCGNQRE